MVFKEMRSLFVFVIDSKWKRL